MSEGKGKRTFRERKGSEERYTHIYIDTYAYTYIKNCFNLRKKKSSIFILLSLIGNVFSLRFASFSRIEEKDCVFFISTGKVFVYLRNFPHKNNHSSLNP